MIARYCGVVLGLGACSTATPAYAPAPRATPAASASAAVTPRRAAPPASRAAASPAAAPSAAPAASAGSAPTSFPSPEAAFESVLATKPRVLAIGEAHAQKGTEAITSTTRRFTEQLLPRLHGRARDLVVELLVPDPKCRRKTVEHVAEQQRPVTEPQAAGNQNEFLELAKHAKALGIQPHPLVPTCAELEAISSAGASDIERMLTTVADVSLRTLSALLDRAASPGAPTLLLAYGGALHNDVAPRPGREKWSFGPALAARTPGYVELDLIVPEYVRDTESWRAFSWYADFSARPPNRDTLLYRTGPASYALIFPRSGP